MKIFHHCELEKLVEYVGNRTLDLCSLIGARFPVLPFNSGHLAVFPKLRDNNENVCFGAVVSNGGFVVLR